MIRALIVDDIPLFRKGLSTTLEQTGDCSIVGEPTQIADIVDLTRAHRPDVILLSESLVSASALEVALLLLREDQHGLFVLSEQLTEEWLFRFMLAGAAAYETRWISQAELAEKVQRVASGEYLLSSDTLDTPHPAPHDALRNRSVPGDWHAPSRDCIQGPACPLTSDELRLLAQIAQGWSTRQIAQALAIRDEVATNRIASLFHKLEVRDRTSAVMQALKRQWIDLEGLAAYAGEPGGGVQQPAAHRRSTRPRTPPSHKALSLAHSPSMPQVCYRLQWAFCGKARCKKCRSGAGHGPYWYEYQVIDGRTVRRYIGKALPQLGQVQVDVTPSPARS